MFSCTYMHERISSRDVNVGCFFPFLLSLDFLNKLLRQHFRFDNTFIT